MAFVDDATFYEEEKNSPLLSHRHLDGKVVLENIKPRIGHVLTNALRLNSHPKLEFPDIEVIKKISGLNDLSYDVKWVQSVPSNDHKSEDCKGTKDNKSKDCKCEKNEESKVCKTKDCKCDDCKCTKDHKSEDCKCGDCKCGDSLQPLPSESDICADLFESLSIVGKDDYFSKYIKEMDESVFKFAETMPTEEHLRIFKLDGERTFKNPKRQQILVNTLKMLYYMIGDYHQGEGFVTAYFLIFMNPPEVIKLVWILHCFYVNGYFSTVPSSYIRDSIVFIEMLKKRDSKYGEFLENQITPQAYVSKWFIGLTIYVHSIILNCYFIEQLVSKGQSYLFSYALTLVLELKDKIMKHNDVSKSLEYLRLDNVDEDFCEHILKESVKLDIQMDEINKMRKEANDILEAQNKARKEREKAMEYSDDEIVFSDEE